MAHSSMTPSLGLSPCEMETDMPLLRDILEGGCAWPQVERCRGCQGFRAHIKLSPQRGGTEQHRGDVTVLSPHKSLSTDWKPKRKTSISLYDHF